MTNGPPALPGARSYLPSAHRFIVLSKNGRFTAVVEVTVTPDGSGEVVVTATADAAVVDKAPTLADDIRVDDFVESGWTVEGPTPTGGGGLELILRRPFASVAEANAILAQLSAADGPLTGLTIGVGGTTGDVMWTFDGQLDLSRSLDSFADQELVGLVGGTPWLAAVEAEGLKPSEVAGVTFRISLPGTRVTEPDVTVAPGAAEWSANAGDAPVVMSSKTLATSLEVRDARRLERRTVNLLLAYGVVVLLGVAIWRVVRSQRRNRRRGLAR